MQIVLKKKIKGIHNVYKQPKKQISVNTQKPTIAPYEEPNQSTKSNMETLMCS